MFTFAFHPPSFISSIASGNTGVYTTVDRTNEEMGHLGFPGIGLPETVQMEVLVTEEVTEVETDYHSPVAEYGVIWCTLLCGSEELESYKEAVLEHNDSDMEGSGDFAEDVSGDPESSSNSLVFCSSTKVLSEPVRHYSRRLKSTTVY
ncbi:hypothetical protein BDV93DRAFT_512404 [Ceratobasidium sp. AG-I]|nr:hypothetical protein BDV93DRAFT_512404 [Ceratobasidium sp. AG-I]